VSGIDESMPTETKKIARKRSLTGSMSGSMRPTARLGDQ
jgi:hypothetical protein